MGHLLGPHVVGQRVVVRRRLPGETGPSGGPLMTDVLGVCTAWDDVTATLRRADDTEVTIAIADIVSGKPVPPRPSVRMRVTPREAQVRALALWPQLDTAPVGDWLLRWSSQSHARRANSVLAMGPSGLDDRTAVRTVVEHYRGLGRSPVAAVEPESPEEALFRAHGWGPEGEDADALFLIAGVAAARRRLADRAPIAVSLDDDGRHATARIPDGASGVAALDGDWLGLRTVEVAPHLRRRGLGLALVAALLDWGAERGATTAYLQVISDNTAAMSLYEQLGFATHHAYRYLAPA